MTDPGEYDDIPPYIARKMQRDKEIREIVASVTPKPKAAPDVPAGYFGWDSTPDSEVADYLTTLGIHSPKHHYPSA